MTEIAAPLCYFHDRNLLTIKIAFSAKTGGAHQQNPHITAHFQHATGALSALLISVCF